MDGTFLTPSPAGGPQQIRTDSGGLGAGLRLQQQGQGPRKRPLKVMSSTPPESSPVASGSGSPITSGPLNMQLEALSLATQPNPPARPLQPPTAFLVCLQSRGLVNDAHVLGNELQKHGYNLRYIVDLPAEWDSASLHWTRPIRPAPRPRDLVVFLENVCPLRELMMSQARKVLVPNVEFLSEAHVQWAVACLDEVWHKTRASLDIFDLLSGCPSPGLNHRFLGFTSRSLYDPAVIHDHHRPLHIFGASPFKGTRALLEVWAKHPEWPVLTVVGRRSPPPSPYLDASSGVRCPTNIRPVSDLSDPELSRLMNQSGLHLCPSTAEGFGHSHVEAMACAAVVIGTDAEPFREHIEDGVTGFLVAVTRRLPYSLAARRMAGDGRGNNAMQWSEIDPAALESIIQRVLGMGQGELAAMGERARRWYLGNKSAFEGAVAKLAGVNGVREGARIEGGGEGESDGEA